MTNATNTSSLAPAAPPAAIPRRLEGRDKVRGRARYAGDITKEEMGGVLDVAVAVTSTQASGQVQAIDDAAALKMPGVRLVVTHENAPAQSPLAHGGRNRRPAALAGQPNPLRRAVPGPWWWPTPWSTPAPPRQWSRCATRPLTQPRLYPD